MVREIFSPPIRRDRTPPAPFRDNIYYKCDDCGQPDFRNPSCGKESCIEYAKWWKEKGASLHYRGVTPDGMTYEDMKVTEPSKSFGERMGLV